MLIAMVNNAQQVTAVNDAAAGGGLSAGMTLSHARALVPDIQTAPADPEGDRAVLEKLADWCCRYSPVYGIDDSALDCMGENHGLWIDSTGCAHLFDGEEAMLADLEHRLAGFGLRPRLGLADTIGAAWALARCQRDVCIAFSARDHEILKGLPVAGLRLTAATLTLLRRLGLKTVGQLSAMPRVALAKRFSSKAASEMVLCRLDQLFGHGAEPLTPRRSPPIYRAERTFLDPLTEPEALALGLEHLTSALCGWLTKTHEGAERLALHAFRVDGDVRTLRVGASLATRDPAHINRLFAEKLERIDPGFGIEKLALHAERTAPIETSQGKLEGGGAVTSSGDERLAQLIDRLANRLGDEAVTVIAPVESHIPEQAERHLAAGQGGSPAALERWTVMPSLDGRPSCLLARPEPIKALAEVPDGPPLRFTWRRVTHRIVKADGPERLSPGWFGLVNGVDLSVATRDYYRVEDDEGRRYWLFRRGLYDAPGQDDQITPASPVDWFLHGMFG